MIVTTSQGTQFQIDPSRRRLRTIGGAWAEYEEIGPVKLGRPVVVIWRPEDRLNETVTDPIVAVNHTDVLRNERRNENEVL